MNTILAFLHHLAVLTMLACALISSTQLMYAFDLNRARVLRKSDTVNAIAATLVLLIGLIRIFYLEKGAAYYFHNGPFIAKLVLYGVASMLSLVPTIEIRLWRVPLEKGLLPVVNSNRLYRMRTVAFAQLVCIFAMAACAVLAARGIDLQQLSY